MEHVDDHHAPCDKQLQGASAPFLRTNGQRTFRGDHNTCWAKAIKCPTRPGASVSVPGRGLGVETKFGCNHKHGQAAAYISSWQPEIAFVRALTCSLRSAAPPGPVARRTHRQLGRPRTPKISVQNRPSHLAPSRDVVWRCAPCDLPNSPPTTPRIVRSVRGTQPEVKRPPRSGPPLQCCVILSPKVAAGHFEVYFFPDGPASCPQKSQIEAFGGSPKLSQKKPRGWLK